MDKLQALRPVSEACVILLHATHSLGHLSIILAVGPPTPRVREPGDSRAARHD